MPFRGLGDGKMTNGLTRPGRNGQWDHGTVGPKHPAIPCRLQHATSLLVSVSHRPTVQDAAHRAQELHREHDRLRKAQPFSVRVHAHVRHLIVVLILVPIFVSILVPIVVVAMRSTAAWPLPVSLRSVLDDDLDDDRDRMKTDEDRDKDRDKDSSALDSPVSSSSLAERKNHSVTERHERFEPPSRRCSTQASRRCSWPAAAAGHGAASRDRQ